MLTREEIFCVWLDSFIGLEYKNKIFLTEFAENYGFKEMDKVFKSEREKIVLAIGESAFNTVITSCTKEYTQYVLSELDKREITPITIKSELYPKNFLDYPIPPFVLYAKGNLNLLKEQIFGIVGSRKSITHSIKIAEDYTKSLISAGFTLVTGIAEGIDSTVIKTCLEEGGNIISVVAGGFDHIYPRANYSLAEKIEKYGLLLSEHVPDAVALPFMFPTRNRIIAGLSCGVLIVSGRLKSGTMYTAEYAEDYGKPLFAIPYSVGVESGAGCNELIKRGARLTDTPNDILVVFDKAEITEKIELTEEESEIYNLLKDGSKHVEEICNTLNKRIFEITPTLSALEIKGLIVKSGANLYSATK